MVGCECELIMVIEHHIDQRGMGLNILFVIYIYMYEMMAWISCLTE